MPETPISLTALPGWQKHALARQRMRPLDFTDRLAPSVSLVSLVEWFITSQPTGATPWQDHTPEFVGGPLPVPVPDITSTEVTVWLREAVENHEQVFDNYFVILTLLTSDDQHFVHTERLRIFQTGRTVN